MSHKPLRAPSPSRGCARALALCLALGPVAHARAAAPARDHEQLIAEADELTGQGRHADALTAYAQAFEAMPPALQSSGVGELVAVGAGDAALADFRERGDVGSLERGRAVLLRFAGAVQSASPSSSPASLDEAKARLAEIEAAMPPADGPPATPAPAPDAARDDGPAPATDDAPPERSRVGLGLAIGGGVAVLAGVGLVVAGLRQVPWYEDKLAGEGWQPTDEGYDQQIAQAERTRNVDAGIGAAALVVGVGLGVTGAVLLARGRGVKRTVAWAPVMGRERALVTATLRF